MRGSNERQAGMLLGVPTESLIPAKHPIQRTRELVGGLLVELSPLVKKLYAERGRPPIPAELLLEATLLMAFYWIRSKRQFC